MNIALFKYFFFHTVVKKNLWSVKYKMCLTLDF